ncbi:MAG: IMPACT family protein [Chitinophagaceae bacterium]
MTGEFFYTTIEKPGMSEFRDRGSRFIAYAYPVVSAEECKAHRDRLRKEHPKAVHHCFAYRLGTDGNLFRANDDGEPSGSAGRPILGQIDSMQLTDVLVVVVRYFGGTLLGVPGLIHAYRTSALEALQATVFIQKPIRITYLLQFDYTRMNEVMRLVKQFDCLLIRQELHLFCLLEIGVPAAVHQKVLDQLGNLHGVECSSV